MSFLYWREDDPDYDGNEIIVPCPQCGKPAKDWGTLIWCREGEHLTAQVSYELEVCPTKHAPDVVESAASSEISPASEVPASEAESKPATTQVM